MHAFTLSKDNLLSNDLKIWFSNFRKYDRVIQESIDIVMKETLKGEGDGFGSSTLGKSGFISKIKFSAASGISNSSSNLASFKIKQKNTMSPKTTDPIEIISPNGFK